MNPLAELQTQIQRLSDDELVTLWLAEAQRPDRDAGRILNGLVSNWDGSETGPVVVHEAIATWTQREAVAAIWQEPMLTPRAAAEALGAKPTNREKVRRLRERSELLGLPHERSYLYPAFQFDVNRRRIFPEVKAVNQLLDAAHDPWGVASWWISQHDRLDARPAELVCADRAADLIAVAEAMLEPIG